METVDKKINSCQEMKKFGADLAGNVLKSAGRSSGALVFALEGELGAGKTQFVKGFAQGLGIKQPILSPTFVIWRPYKIPSQSKSNFNNFFHLDCYRLESLTDAYTVRIDKILKNSANIAAIEWPQVVVRLIPTDAWHLKFIITGKNQRTVKIQRMKN